MSFSLLTRHLLFISTPHEAGSFRDRVFLVVPAALLAAVACIGYLRRCQREVCDFLAMVGVESSGKQGCMICAYRPTTF